MNRKGAFQLSLGMIVVLVFAVILLTLAISWIQGMFSEIGGVSTKITEIATQALLDDLAAAGDRVGLAVPDRTKWNRGETGQFALGIRNDDPTQAKMYKINIYLQSISGIDDISPYKTIAENSLRYAKTEFRAAGESDTSLIDISIPTITEAPLGSYLFRVMVCKGDAPVCTEIDAEGMSLNDIYGTDQFILEITG